MEKSHAVLLLSGGLDSIAHLLLLKDKISITALSFDYGQKSTELRYAQYWTEKYKIPHRIVDLAKAEIWKRNSLIKGTPGNFVEEGEVPIAVRKKNLVDGRNPLFLFLGAIYASELGADNVIIGLEPGASVYLDGEDNYFSALNELIKLTIVSPAIVMAPFYNIPKVEILTNAYRIDNELFDKTTSCYEGEECGKCVHCQVKKLVRAEVLSRLVEV